MIKINLLGIARPVPVKPVGPPPTVGRHALTFVISLVVAMAIVGFFYRYWSGQVAALEQNLRQEKIRQAELAEVRAQNLRYQQQLRALQQRSDTIQMLQSARTGPVDLMNSLGVTAIRNNDLYLLTIGPEAGRVVIRGQANTVESIASFLSGLKQSGSFTGVQLRNYFQDDQHDRVSYKFNIDCEYKLPAAAVTTGQPATPTGAPAKRAGM